MSRYTRVDGDANAAGNPWEVGTIDGRLVVMWGRLTMKPADQDRFAEAVARAVTPGQPATCAYCEDDPDHPDPDNPGTCTCESPGCGRGWCPQRDAVAEIAEEEDGDG